MVLEKAFAKFCGNYEFLEVLLPRVLLKDLTGIPNTEFNLNDMKNEKIHQILDIYYKKGLILLF